MKIAIVGTGIAGNVAANRLARDHEITVFEADSRIGGHTNTIDVSHEGQRYAIDTGFIVFNGKTYPNFVKLLQELGVAWQDSNMGFSVRNETSGLEYNGSTLNSLFAQRSNLLRPSFYRMIRDILRFNEQAPRLLEPDSPETSLASFLAVGNYSNEFINHFIIPMGAAIWSAKPSVMRRMPARFFVRFFQNHGMLSVNERPMWRVIKGGSKVYVDKLVEGHRNRIQLNAPVESVLRFNDHVKVVVRGQEAQKFDHVFLACHADQALKILSAPSNNESRVLSAFGYQDNEAILHTDESLMPKRKRAWAAWNYHIPARAQQQVALTYNMNTLQGIDAPVQFCVTLNHEQHIDPDKIIHRVRYSHPVFTPEAVAAQSHHATINGTQRTYFCGAYWRNGFHEDGVVSALEALQHFNQRTDHEQRNFLRTG